MLEGFTTLNVTGPTPPVVVSVTLGVFWLNVVSVDVIASGELAACTVTVAVALNPA